MKTEYANLKAIYVKEVELEYASRFSKCLSSEEYLKAFNEYRYFIEAFVYCDETQVFDMNVHTEFLHWITCRIFSNCESIYSMQADRDFEESIDPLCKELKLLTEMYEHLKTNVSL
jgi:hypothetical protein